MMSASMTRRKKMIRTENGKVEFSGSGATLIAEVSLIVSEMYNTFLNDIDPDEDDLAECHADIEELFMKAVKAGIYVAKGGENAESRRA